MAFPVPPVPNSVLPGLAKGVKSKLATVDIGRTGQWAEPCLAGMLVTCYRKWECVDHILMTECRDMLNPSSLSSNGRFHDVPCTAVQ
jgi:hypothetical protein